LNDIAISEPIRLIRRFPRPQSLDAYAGADAGALAAAYAYGLARNHGFADGNKRAALGARLFLVGKGYRLEVERADAVETMEIVAAGALEGAAPAEWFQQRIAG
jgi:death on curing protein